MNAYATSKRGGRRFHPGCAIAENVRSDWLAGSSRKVREAMKARRIPAFQAVHHRKRKASEKRRNNDDILGDASTK
jgi:hypothetical protein